MSEWSYYEFKLFVTVFVRMIRFNQKYLLVKSVKMTAVIENHDIHHTITKSICRFELHRKTQILRTTIFILFFVVISGNLVSQKLKDTLFFKNGSMVLGEIKTIKLGVVNFDPDDANDISVQLIKLKTITAPGVIFRIETTDDHVLYGKLFPNARPGYVTIVNEKDTVEWLLEGISVLYPFKDAFLDRFSGNVGLGYTYTRSSNFGRFNFDLSANYVTRKDEVSFGANGIYSVSDTAFSRDQENVNLKYNYYVGSTWFLTAFLSYQRNLELGISRRLQQGLGVGNKFITTQHIYGWLRTGVAINQQQSTDDVKSGTLTELFGQVQFNFFRFTAPKISLDFSQTLFYSLSQKDRIRNSGQTNLSWELISDFNLNLGFYNNYDSKPPASAASTFDFGIVFGLSYKF